MYENMRLTNRNGRPDNERAPFEFLEFSTVERDGLLVSTHDDDCWSEDTELTDDFAFTERRFEQSNESLPLIIECCGADGAFSIKNLDAFYSTLIQDDSCTVSNTNMKGDFMDLESDPTKEKGQSSAGLSKLKAIIRNMDRGLRLKGKVSITSARDDDEEAGSDGRIIEPRHRQ